MIPGEPAPTPVDETYSTWNDTPEDGDAVNLESYLGHSLRDPEAAKRHLDRLESTVRDPPGLPTYEETIYGFKYGAAEVTRTASVPSRNGSGHHVVLTIKTPRETLTVRVTPSGLLRLNEGAHVAEKEPYPLAGGWEGKLPAEKDLTEDRVWVDQDHAADFVLALKEIEAQLVMLGEQLTLAAELTRGRF